MISNLPQWLWVNFTNWSDSTNYQLTAPVVHRFAGAPSGLWHIQPPHINKHPSPLSVLTERQGRQVPSMSQLNRLDTSHNRHWSLQCNRIRCCVFRQKQRKKNKIQVSRIKHMVLCYPMSQGISHQTAFLTINWHKNEKAEHTNISKYYYHHNYGIYILQFLLDEIIQVKGVWILQKLYEGTETCRRGFYMCVTIKVITSYRWL
jgi:hypothetical protein